MEPIPAVGPLIDPAANSLHILLVAANLRSRQAIEATLYTCNYQVTACKTSQEAIQVLKAQQGPGGAANFDLILKDHCPSSGTNTCRFLRRAQHEQLLQGIPVIVASAEEDRDLMVNCLQLGAADFMLKPLRASDLRNLWARVYWWRRATYHHSPVASNPALNNDCRSGSASDETREQTTEPQEAALDQGLCAEGSEPTIKSIIGRSNESGDQSKESKGHNGWSGNKTNGDSKPGTQQGSNNPSIPSQHTADPVHLMAMPSSAARCQGHSFHQIPPEFAPLDLQTRQTQSHKAVSNAAELRAPPTGANPGFRAYVASEQQNQGVKRSLPDLSSREDPGSSGSDWTNSLDKANQNKRQAVQSIPDNNGFNMSNGISALTQARMQGQQHQQNYQTQPKQNQQQSNTRPPTDEGRVIDKSNGAGEMQQPSNMPPGFPFCFVPGMMPPPFGLPQFWTQANGENKGHQNMPMMFPSFGTSTQNGPDAENSNMQQQAQQAMHNQIMYHHNLLMQQYGMTPPFMQYSAFATAAHKPSPQEANHQPPVPVVAKRQKTHPGAIPNSSSQMMLTAKSLRQTENITSSITRGPQQQQNGMQPPSQANGESMNPFEGPQKPAGPMGVDGFLLEPSRKQRRAEALHKYKQKRKNLNFTKKIRYESRKQLAQARPRVKGQFVRITSEDVDAVVDSLTPAQMKGVADGTTDVTQLLIENAKTSGDAVIKQEDLTNQEPDISDEDESEPIEEDDVSSPASKDCVEKTAFTPAPLPSLPNSQQVAQLIGNLEQQGRRNSSHSDSNSPEADNADTRHRETVPCN